MRRVGLGKCQNFFRVAFDPPSYFLIALGDLGPQELDGGPLGLIIKVLVDCRHDKKVLEQRTKTACAGLASQCCDVVLVRGAFSSGKPQGVGISEWGGNGEGWKWGDQFTSNRGPGWTDPVTARRVPSK